MFQAQSEGQEQAAPAEPEFISSDHDERLRAQIRELGEQNAILLKNQEELDKSITQRLGITEGVIDQLLGQLGKRVQVIDNQVVVVARADGIHDAVQVEQLIPVIVTIDGREFGASFGSQEEADAFLQLASRAREFGMISPKPFVTAATDEVVEAARPATRRARHAEAAAITPAEAFGDDVDQESE